MLGLLAIPGFADDAPPTASESVSHPIAHRIDACIEEGGWQPDAMLSCARTAEEEWQEEVERLTERLSSVLGSEPREALEESDQAWQISRHADLAFIDAYHDQLVEAEVGDPELLPLTRQLHRNAVLESRVDLLQRFLSGLETMPESFSSDWVPLP
jgi:hypothetical protein